MRKSVTFASVFAVALLCLSWQWLHVRTELLFAVTCFGWIGVFGVVRGSQMGRGITSGPGLLLIILGPLLIAEGWQLTAREWKVLVGAYGFAIWGITLWWGTRESSVRADN